MSPGFWWSYFFALVVVSLMLLGLYIVSRSIGRARTLVAADRRLVSVLESTALSTNTSVHVVKAGERYFLIGGGVGHLATLGELPSEEVGAWLSDQRQLLSRQTGALQQFMRRWRRE